MYSRLRATSYKSCDKGFKITTFSIITFFIFSKIQKLKIHTNFFLFWFSPQNKVNKVVVITNCSCFLPSHYVALFLNLFWGKLAFERLKKQSLSLDVKLHNHSSTEITNRKLANLLIKYTNMAQLESLGTFDRISELQTLTKTVNRNEPVALVDYEALENATDNLMQHLSMDHLDMLHHRFVTGEVMFWTFLVPFWSHFDPVTWWCTWNVWGWNWWRRWKINGSNCPWSGFELVAVEQCFCSYGKWWGQK